MKGDKKTKPTRNAYASPPAWRTLLLPFDTVVATESMRALHALLAITAADSTDQVCIVSEMKMRPSPFQSDPHPAA